MKKKLLIASLIILAIPLLLYLIGVIVFFIIFPANGYRSSTTAGTNSMYPVLIGKSLIIENKNIPFEDLKVGDIITYREPVDWGSNVFRTEKKTVKIWKKGEPEPTPTPTPLYKDEGIEYKAEYIVHRIVEVIDGQGDRALICKGDNNPENDPFPVMKSGYIGKVVWFSSELGPVFNAVYRGHIILVPMAVFGILGVCLVRMMTKDDERGEGRKAEKSCYVGKTAVK